MITRDRPSLDAEIRARDGAVCIYAEKRWIAHTRIALTVLTHKQLSFKVSALPTPGFTPPRPTWEAGVALAHLRYSPDCWMGSPYLAWILAFDPNIISALVATAEKVQHLPDDERAIALRGQLGSLLWPELSKDG